MKSDNFHKDREEHVRVRELVMCIGSILEASGDSGGGPQNLITELRDLLLEHFGREELGGYLIEVRTAAPQLTGRAEELLKEHGQLRARCDELVELVRKANRSVPRERMADEFQRFAHDLFAHESAENDLVYEAFAVDLGFSR